MSRKKKESLSFEESMDRLEEIVHGMEGGELPLENILESYEEGMKLVVECGDKLSVAEQKIELLTKAKSEMVSGSEIDEAEGDAALNDDAEGEEGSSANDDVSLF